MAVILTENFGVYASINFNLQFDDKLLRLCIFV